MKEGGLKILSVGNSFSADTMEHLPGIVKSLGIENFKFGNLYIGGCSIHQHYSNALSNCAEYNYYTHTADQWIKTPERSIADAVGEEDWDIISIQHGTKDRSRYTSPESYRDLAPLIRHIRTLAGKPVKIAFNMAWVMEPDGTHHEIRSYNGDQLLMYRNLTALTRDLVAAEPEVDVVSPAGTAIQNARTCYPEKLTRDNFHLSFGLGRYIAALTFLKALCGLDIDGVRWHPDSVTEEERDLAIRAANAAVKSPYTITQL